MMNIHIPSQYRAVIAAAAFAMGLCACQENTVFSQSEIEPALVTDAMEFYKIDPLLPEEISFNVSANTPWKIAVSCDDEFAGKPWLQVSPRLSAVSSLVERVSVKINDNNTYKDRVAVLTITADGIDSPTIITLRQSGRGNLTVSSLQPQSMVPMDGGQLTFTVVSNRAWSAHTDASWVMLDTTEGEASDQAVTVTVTAAPTEGLGRKAIITVSTELDEVSLEVSQDGMTLELSNDTQNDKFDYSYAGETHTYYVRANVDWNVSTDNNNVKATKIDNTSFELTVPYARAFTSNVTNVTLRPSDPASPVAPYSFKVSQEAAVSFDCGILDGNTLTASEASANKARVKTKDSYKYGEFIWTFGKIDISDEAYFSINNWGTNGVYLMLQFGNNKHQLSAGGSVTVNGKAIHFGFDNGWGGQWNDYAMFNEGTYPTSVSEMKTLRLRIEPTKRTGTNQNNTLSRKVWINDVLVLDNSANVGDIWCEGSTQPGLQYLFGIENGTGSMTIESFEYKEL